MLLSLRKYAEHRGVSHAAVQKAIRQGRIRPTSEGQIHVEQADRDWVRNTGPVKEPKERITTPFTPGPSFAQSRAVRELYLARLAKIEFEVRSGKLIRTEEVEQSLAIIVRTLRDRLLALPDRLATTLATLSAGEIRSTLTAEIRQGLSEVAREFRAHARYQVSAQEGDYDSSEVRGNGAD